MKGRCAFVAPGVGPSYLPRVVHRAEDYPTTADIPWLDRPDAMEQIAARQAAGEIDGRQAGLLRKWVRDGYVSLSGVLDQPTVDEINADVAAVIEANQHLPIAELRLKIQDNFTESAATRRAMMLPSVLEFMDLLLGRRALPYQTLSLPVSSQIAPHVDAILMTSHPRDYLIAAWFALESIQPDSGPLVLYPGSHKLPYISAGEVGIPRGASEAECSSVYDARFYDLVAERVESNGFQLYTHLPACGDVLFWHSNLVHGATAPASPDATRKSLIVHYFGEGAEHYSDLFNRRCDLPGLR